MFRTARIAATIAGIVALGATADVATAKRTASAADSRAMWKVVDKQGHCQHKRAVLSTVKSARYVYGRVTVADTTCGDGVFVLRRAKSGKRWSERGAGSDWGNPDRCAADIKKIPLRVLQDLFARDICATM